MRGTVISPFWDRLDPSRCCKVGDVYEGDAERIAELVASGHVVAAAGEPEPEPKPKPRAKRATARRTTKG